MAHRDKNKLKAAGMLRLLSLWLAIALQIASAKGTAATPEIDRPMLSCDFGDVMIDVSFSSARLNSCKQTEKGVFSVSTAPENVPINPSPWYAFKVYSENLQDITLYLHYPLYTHRYLPKISTDGRTWQAIEQDDMELLFDGKAIKLRLSVGPDALWVAAQEIIDNKLYDSYTSELAELDFLERKVLGSSVDGRPIYMLETTTPADRYIVLIGRQHPPEITGALGMKHFIDRIVLDEPLANAFREKYGILLVPNMSPDGVEYGFWRHNMGGVDLNRDWGPFTQPETQLMRDQLNRFLQPGMPQLSLFLDFHSTNRDVFYTQTREMTHSMPDFTDLWFEQVQERMLESHPDYELEVRPGYNAESTVAKNWVSKVFGVPAITFEYGDETPRTTIEQLSIISAEEMMKLLLSSEN
jgi:cytosolic carboxypeptidase protein 6